MDEIITALNLVAGKLPNEDYAQSLAFFRFWLDVGQTYHQLPPDLIFNAIWNNRTKGSTIYVARGKLINSAAHLTLRFASDIESDHITAPHASGLQSRLCKSALQAFFSNNLSAARDGGLYSLYIDANIIAHWANLGYVEETAIRNHVLQSLISHPTLHDHQVHTLLILFRLAGATFEAYAEPAVVDRCFELLKNHCIYDRRRHGYDPGMEELERVKQVRAPCMVTWGYRAKVNA